MYRQEIPPFCNKILYLYYGCNIQAGKARWRLNFNLTSSSCQDHPYHSWSWSSTEQPPIMFCTNLRRRASFVYVLPLLITTEGLKLRGE